VEPHLDGQRIRYAGPLDDRQKSDLLGSAAGFLMPILWDEPFGLVMAEALACGTPVIAFGRGAVPEIVTHGSDGFICDDVGEMAACVRRLGEIPRRACRETAEKRFSGRAMTDGYEALYKRLLGARPTGAVR
jgi:glycosyltransferase involved in cell wall biosynthesis